MGRKVSYITIVSLITQSLFRLPVHKLISGLIRKHSLNKEDVRDLAIRLVDWSGIHTILDLGSGYGWFEQGLKGSFDLIMGVDCLQENKDEFLKAAGKVAKEPVFRKALLPAPLRLRPIISTSLWLPIHSIFFLTPLRR